jgi:tetratricopeptide (TPR) repeat protein
MIDPRRRVTSLVGFGGEGKSSLARRLVDQFIDQRTTSRNVTLNGIFWWGFYEKRSVDEFFGAALDFLDEGRRFEGPQFTSASLRAKILGKLLSEAGPNLFVLDGLEVVQHTDGDQFGLLTSSDLRELLSYFCSVQHDSLCLITTRAPVLDLQEFNTYTHREVSRLSTQDGRSLLKQLKVEGKDQELDLVVEAWDGHALTLSLLGRYPSKHGTASASQLGKIDPPKANDSRYEGVYRILKQYDEDLSAPERAFLEIFSAFRTPVPLGALERVFRLEGEESTVTASSEDAPSGTPRGFFALDAETLSSLVGRLSGYRLLRRDATGDSLTAHPLVGSFYLDRLHHDSSDLSRDVHRRIAQYYVELERSRGSAKGSELGENRQPAPTLKDLVNWIEVVHHWCQAGDYDQAEKLRYEKIDHGVETFITYVLGAYDTALGVFRDFFPDGNFDKEPLVTNPRDKSYILNGVGICLSALGRLREAPELYERSIAIDRQSGDYFNVSVTSHNLGTIYLQLGQFARAEDVAKNARDAAQRHASAGLEGRSLALLGAVAHALGDVELSGKLFLESRSALEGDEPIREIYGVNSLWYAEHLIQVGHPEVARKIVDEVLEQATQKQWPDTESRCLLLRGEVEAALGEEEKARANFDKAVKISRTIAHRVVQAEALAARGRWAARRGEVGQATNDLADALDLSLVGGFRVTEVGIRLGLTWCYFKTGNSERARLEALRALQMSEEMRYYWGERDAKDALAGT